MQNIVYAYPSRNLLWHFIRYRQKSNAKYKPVIIYHFRFAVESANACFLRAKARFYLNELNIPCIYTRTWSFGFYLF